MSAHDGLIQSILDFHELDVERLTPEGIERVAEYASGAYGLTREHAIDILNRLRTNAALRAAS